jgi:hypothetical protein
MDDPNICYWDDREIIISEHPFIWKQNQKLYYKPKLINWKEITEEEVNIWMIKDNINV